MMDLIGRFEAKSSSSHTYDALAAIQRLRDDGSTFWDEGSPQLRRWREYNDTLHTFLCSLEQRRRAEQLSLETAQREFFQEFEHSEAGMYEMLYGVCGDAKNNLAIRQFIDWCNLIYRLATYALTATWIDDKREEASLEISVSLSSGKRTERWTRTPMRVPKRYRSRAKRL